MLNSTLKIFVGILGAALIINLVILDFIWISQTKDKPVSSELTTIARSTPTVVLSPQPTKTEACSAACQDLIHQEVINSLPTVTVKEPTPVPSSSGFIASVRSFYIPITYGGSSTLMDWTDLVPSDFYFDLSDYPGRTSVRWEIYLRAVNASSKVYARLYDVTNKRGVDNSELETSLGTFVFLRSSDLKIWQGNNLYRIQLKSANGTEVNIGLARLKISL